MSSTNLLGLSQLQKKAPRKRENLDHLSEKERVARRKITNRVSAQAARERKKMYITTLEQMVENLKKENESIRSSSRQLEESLLCLREENSKLRSTAAQPTSMSHDCEISSQQRGNVAAVGSDSDDDVDDELMGFVPIDEASVKSAETVHFTNLLDDAADGVPQLPCQPSISSSNGCLTDLSGSKSDPDAAFDLGIDWSAQLDGYDPLRDLLNAEPFGEGLWSQNLLSGCSAVRTFGACSPTSACTGSDDEHPASDSGCEMSPGRSEPLSGVNVSGQTSLIDSLLQEINQSAYSPSSSSSSASECNSPLALDGSSLTSSDLGYGSPLSLTGSELGDSEWLDRLLDGPLNVD